MIRVQNIQKAFGGTKVLKGVSFEVEPGTIYGLIGKNGAGKTTLMKIMTQLLPADGGSVEYTDVAEGSVGYLPDLPGFYEYLTTDEYLDFLLQDKNPIRRNKLLETVSLKPNLRIKTMSRGMRQRLGIAAVLVSDPKILLLDEPTSALDPAGRAEVRTILQNLKKEGRTIILSTHILADMDSICDKAGFLHGGVIVREVDLKESRKTASGMILQFEQEPDLKLLSQYIKPIYKIDPLTIKVLIDEQNRIESQQQILKGLSLLEQPGVSIRSTCPRLDEVFAEVCV